ncbi:amino acid adenylation domain-containing protein [Halotia wernerae UHCC 0503]|nr:amino acid adenylation domain-containing protein [Halotia wernerae UHCC 0503]
MDKKPVAIVGIGCRFPKASTPKAFWDLLCDGVDAISEIPPSRWELDPDSEKLDKINTRWGGFLEQVDLFDPKFFGISSREAASMDPQQRLLLEVTWEALEDAGQIPKHLAGTQTGVFIGISTQDFSVLTWGNSGEDIYKTTGTSHCISANRISYVFNFTGPSVAFDTACSSSLVAVHYACLSLWNQESTLAVAGGVNVMLSPKATVNFAKAGFMAPDGRCKTFDARADGYVRAEGAGVVILKPLSQAQADGDRIYAVIQGSAVNQDGRSNGLTAPNLKAQEAVLREAYFKASVSPGQIQYVEAHGTGTMLGDPIEMKALGKVLAERRPQGSYCKVGSVKTNIGHLEAAAGIAGLIKVALSLKHRQIPPNLHFQQPNPYIPFDKLPVRVQQTLEPWPQGHDLALAGVSSFGFGGTNAHVVLAEAPLEIQKHALERSEGVKSQKKEAIERPVHLLTLSAKSEKALLEMVQSYQEFLLKHSEVSLADVCFTANTGRTHFDYRCAVVAESKVQLQKELSAFTANQETNTVVSGQVKSKKRPKVAFLFTGQGSQYIGMGRQLYETAPIFRKTLDRCDEIVRSYLDKSLLTVLYPEAGETSLLDQTVYTQPALFAIEYALAQLWKAWGVVPTAVMGHSLGEYVAACVGGVFSLEDGLKLIAARGRLMQALPQDGEMVAALASERQIAPVIQPYLQEVAIAALNGPESVVISGKRETIHLVVAQLEAMGIKTTPLQVSHAFHSPLIEPMLEEFARVASEVTYSPPKIDLISNITGKLAEAQVATPEYWCRHVRCSVRFAAGMEALYRAGYEVFVECGPKPILLGMGHKCLPEEVGRWLPTLRPGQEDWQQILQSLAQLYVEGVQVDWSGFDQDYERRKVALPTYPFQRQHYWIKMAQKPSIQNKQSQIQHAVNPSYWLQQVDSTMNGDSAVNENKLDAKMDASVTTNRRDEILATLQAIVGNLVEVSPAEVNIDSSFLEMGADSIILVEAVRRIENTYGIKTVIRQLFEELKTINTLATYIDQNLSQQWVDPDSRQFNPKVQSQQLEQPSSTQSTPELSLHNTQDCEHRGTVSAETTLERIMTHQLQVMSQQSQIISELMSQQLEVLRGNGSSSKSLLYRNGQLQCTQTITPAVNSPQKEQHNQNQISQATPSSTPAKSELRQPSHQPFSPLSSFPGADIQKKLSLQQQHHLEVLSDRYNQRHQKSRQLAQAYRPVLADSRATPGFRLSIKEMLYPIAGERAQGSRFWDVDGNEYVDITMGFGVLLFGHDPQFITEAVEKHYQQGLKIGPQSKLAGEVAQLICELTGMERVTFCNSGTEAVMTALRLARSATGRTKIALFAGSYHGQFDGILATAAEGEIKAVPSASGVSQNLVENVLVIDYGNPKSIEILQVHAQELAAVLVEPVQSRRPDLQPKEFLRQLRQLTQASGTALIFDEILTGFRIHSGGAQTWFGVEADIVTYGKIIGGGTPIGVVAGKAAYMNGIDGGLWNYGDASYPQAEKIFFAGTFNKNHTGMVAALAVLQHLKKQGPELQQQLNQRTSHLVQMLNSYFEQEDVPIRVVHFGSLFRFAFSGNLDLFFYHLIDKGVYIWEGRSCFLSTAHTDADINYLIQAVKDSIKELQEGGFLPSGSSKLLKIDKNTNETSSDLTPAFSDKNFTPSAFLSQQAVIVAESARKVSLNEAQKQLGILAQISEDGSLAYNVSINLELKGSFQLAAMRKAVQTIVNRHEALRTIISSQNDFQEILPSLTADVALVDFSNASDACGGLRLHERELKVADWLKKESQESFDLSNGPLFRFSILKLEEKLHLLVLTIHHIVADGWSVGVILQELGALYSAECQGVVCRLEPPMQFENYIEWQEKQSQTDTMAAHESYWLEQFAESIPVLDLPTDRPRPRLKTYKGSRQTRRLDANLTREVKRFSTENGCTLLMTLLSVYTTLLHRLTGQNHIIVGMPSAGRSLEGSEKLVGYCAHILPVRSCIVGSESFLEYLKTLKNRLLEIYEHQDYPFARLIDKLNVARDASRSPLVTIIFNWDRSVAVPKMFELATDLFPKPINCTPFDISLNVMEVDRKLVLDCDYNTHLCDASTIERWLGHFQTLLEGVVANPQQCIAELPLLTEAQRHQLLVEWNNTIKEYPFNKCIHQLFEEQVQLTPNAIAVVFENQQLTYQQLNAKANQLAHYLGSLGVKPGVLVGLCLERSLEMVIGLLGILKAGGAYVPLDPDYPQERLSFMLEDAQVSVLLTQQQLVDRLSQYQANLVCLDEVWSQIIQNNQDNPVSEVRAFHIANVIYTSGSTGRPKGVMVEHTGLCNLAQAQIKTFGLRNFSRILQFASLSFDASIWEVVMAFGSGATLYLGTKESLLPGKPLIEQLRNHGITHITLPPSALAVMPAEKLPALQTMIVAGEACSAELIRHWSAGRNFFNAYGPTEATVCATIAKCTDGDKKAPIGRPIANTQIYILDSNLQPVPIGVPGELHIGGAGLARGYLNHPQLTQEKFIPNPFSTDRHSRLYKTGDLARYLPDGNIEYLGRIDHQVKIRGYRIEPGEIEAVLGQNPNVQEAVVIDREDHPGNKRLVAYVVSQQGRLNPLQVDNLAQVLKGYLKEMLPDYMMPSAFVILEALPLTPNGKVDRRALPAPQLHRSSDKFVAPRTPIEEMLAHIWASVLKVEQVGIHDNFFEIGGDSILSIQIVARANTAGLQLTTKQLFQHQTIAELAAVAGTTTIIMQAEQGLVTGPLPLTPIQHWFFNQNLPNPAHWNQACLLEVQQDINPSIIEQVVQHLLVHHDALRLRFERTNSGWQQINTGVDDTVVLNTVDLSAVPQPEQKSHIEAAAASLQASLNLKQGPLVRFAWLFLGHHQSNRLLIVIHHLAVDGVSWRILLEDLQTVYQQLSCGEARQIPLKTTSFKHWAQLLSEYAQSSTLGSELAYWLPESDKQIIAIPVDYTEGTNIEISARTVSVSLNFEETTALLQEVPKAYNTQINDVLLTALVQVLTQWTGSSSILLNLEGHGREEIFEGVDLSRTVGWFTTIFPVFLQLEATNNPGNALKLIKEQLRRIPNRGIGYGLLRYFKGNKEIASKLEALPQAQVSFNYLGQFDQVLYTSSIFQPATESLGPTSHNPEANRNHLLDVNGLVVQGQLRLDWTYSDNVHKHSTIESLAQKFLQALQTLIAHCSSRQARGYTSSDFPDIKLSQETLDAVLVEIDLDSIED